MTLITDGGGIDMVAVDRKGPRTKKTALAQQAVEEFLGMGIPVGRVNWKDISDDFFQAKQALSYRILWSKRHGVDGAEHLSLRSDASKGDIVLIRVDMA